MGSSDGTDMAATEASESTFPEAEVERELNPGDNKEFEMDPISSKVATSLEIKEAAIEAGEREREGQRKMEAMQTLKTTIIVSAAVVAVAGAIFAITKKLRETR